MTRWSLEMESTPILLAAFIQGFGFGFITAPMNLLAFSTLDPALRPDGSSLSSLFRSIGGSVGISIIVTMLARNQQVSHADLAAHVSASSLPGIDLSGLPNPGPAIFAMIDGELSRQALMIAFLDNFYLLSWMLLIFTPLPFLLRKAGRFSGKSPPPTE
jgi:DHA2 family multidrug resistance protein